jgi:hypothetical protein
MRDLAARVTGRIQLTTDGWKAYKGAVEEAFGWDGCDFAQLQKVYGRPVDGATRYSPPECVGVEKEWVMGDPDPQHVSTSYIERANLTLRMESRRFTRLTNGYSKKIANHEAAVAPQFAYYDFCRPHHTLTQAARGVYRTPAMAAGLTDRVWTTSDLIGLLENGASK